MTFRLFNSVQQIIQSDGVGPVAGICRHLSWQARRAFRMFPCELTISQSRLLAQEATGVPALVNAMGMYDFHNMSLLKAALGLRPMIFVDVGANVGSYTLIASEEKAASILSIEPHPATFAMLARNVQMNYRNNVTLFNLAITDHGGQINLTDQPGSSINRVVRDAESNEAHISVSCRTLDDLCAELQVQPDIIKIDVERHEVEVIRGFRKNLKRSWLLLIEGGERPEIRSLMQDSGFMGPVYFHHREKTLSPFPQRRAEDPVYFSPACKNELRALEIKLAVPENAR